MEEDSEVEKEKTLHLEKIKKPYSVVKPTKESTSLWPIQASTIIF